MTEELDASKLNPYVIDEKQPMYKDLKDITTVRGEE